MISEGPTYDETVSSYSCQRNNLLPYTRLSKSNLLSRVRLQMLFPQQGNKQKQVLKDFTKLNLPSGVELMASEEKLEKRYSGPNSVIKRNVTVAKSIYLSGPQVPQPWHGRVGLDDRKGSRSLLSLRLSILDGKSKNSNTSDLRTSTFI